jgi:3-keto-disaccharide hydrolase
MVWLTKGKLAAAVLAGLLIVPATRALFADDKPAASANVSGEKPNTLTDAEKAAGWKLLFNGQNADGWHSFKKTEVLPGWEIKDGVISCVNPGQNARDLCTNDKYSWFELQLDYNISHAGNSGILYHVTDKGGATWSTGPEFQLEDNTAAADQIRCGWLYALYQPPIDPKTGKTLDATKPVGEWNHVRLLVSKEKCEHEINGVKYFDYVLGSEDFNARVAKSKFHTMPDFAKSDTGYIALQGDHGKVSFRNIKVREIK